jgi:hypothetical protein
MLILKASKLNMKETLTKELAYDLYNKRERYNVNIRKASKQQRLKQLRDLQVSNTESTFMEILYREPSNLIC